MTPQGRQDLIAIVCAFIGAGIMRRMVPPIEGVSAVFVSIAGAAIGLMLARTVFQMMKVRETRAAIKHAETRKDQNDADFASALKSHEEDKQP